MRRSRLRYRLRSLILGVAVTALALALPGMARRRAYCLERAALYRTGHRLSGCPWARHPALALRPHGGFEGFGESPPTDWLELQGRHLAWHGYLVRRYEWSAARPWAASPGEMPDADSLREVARGTRAFLINALGDRQPDRRVSAAVALSASTDRPESLLVPFREAVAKEADAEVRAALLAGIERLTLRRNGPGHAEF